MNKKGQSVTVGQIFISVFLFAIILISGMTFYFGSLVDNGASIPEGINQSAIQSSFNTYADDLSDSATVVEKQKSQVPLVGGVIDFFASGIDSIKAGWKSVDFMTQYLVFAKENTELGRFLPTTFWSMVGSILTIILVLVVIGALWRYQLTK